MAESAASAVFVLSPCPRIYRIVALSAALSVLVLSSSSPRISERLAGFGVCTRRHLLHHFGHVGAKLICSPEGLVAPLQTLLPVNLFSSLFRCKCDPNSESSTSEIGEIVNLVGLLAQRRLRISGRNAKKTCENDSFQSTAFGDKNSLRFHA